MRESVFLFRRPCGHIVDAWMDRRAATDIGPEVLDALRGGYRVTYEVRTEPVTIGGDCAHGDACTAPAFVDIVFDAPPGPQSGRFIEAEGPDGAGVRAGEWIDRGDGYHALRIPLTGAAAPPVTLTDQNVKDMRAAVAKLTAHGEIALASGVQLVLDLHRGCNA